MTHPWTSPRILALSLLSAALLMGCTGQGQTPPQGVTSITLTPASASVAVGGTATLTATARDASGQVVPDVAYTWTTSSAAVATVSGGVVSGRSVGGATITARAGTVSSNPVNVAVTAAAPDFGLTLSSERLPVVTGAQASLTVTVDRQGAAGPITLTLGGLPAGASAPSVTIPAGETSATVTVSAAGSAPHSQPTPATLRAELAGKAVTRGVTVTVRGPAGSLDTTFGAGGVVVTSTSAGEDFAHAMTVLPDGKVVVAGQAFGQLDDFVVLRFAQDGTLDPTFGQGGKVVVDFAGRSDIAYAVAAQPDGRLVVVGGASDAAGREGFGALRLTPAGALDPTFGQGGKVALTFPGSNTARARAVAVQPDGRVVLGGEAAFAASGVDFALARLTPSGALDASFGAGGRVTTAVTPESSTDRIFALALQGDRIVAAGGQGFQVARYTSAGALDPTFGQGGKVTDLFPHSSSAAAVLIDAAGRVILAGEHLMNTVAVRLTGGGQPDAGFGTAGRTELPLSANNWDSATALALQADGKLVLGGWVNEGQSSAGNFAVTRLTPGGAPDASFGTGGTVVTPVAPGTKPDFATAAALQADERIPAARILLAGSRNDSNQDVALTRYWP